MIFINNLSSEKLKISYERISKHVHKTEIHIRHSSAPFLMRTCIARLGLRFILLVCKVAFVHLFLVGSRTLFFDPRDGGLPMSY
ncbi:hypothetical protein CDL12_30323 [Handroanthus impetiginosus]|uniref:Uncharacterized protein n=1 Tax=Handroanthus impetiginosus TaxID=429701 RepID=A0A2G9FVV9_9LAMI|nr:hypothetical protein CDL12_30323 [Handroanthus impetiginosus]